MRKKLWGVVAVSLVAAIAGITLTGMGWTEARLPSDEVSLDLAAPDALIRSKSLSRLPADLLRVPLLHDLLTEDFLFYYETSEARLGLKGALRRIAYEHDITLNDNLIRLVLDEPADVALWRGADGSLRYYAISMTRGKLAKLLEPLAKIALKDTQLSLVGAYSVDGQAVQLFALEYAWKRTLLVASHGDRVVIVSDPGMLLGKSGEVTTQGGALLGDLLAKDRARQERFAKAFELGNTASDHTIAVKTNFLSFSYQHFFPALKALRFDFSEKPSATGRNWATAALLDAAPAQAAGLLDAHVLWSSLPGRPGACAAMPVDWLALAKAMNSQAVAQLDADKLAAQFQGPAALCWYANSRLHTPLFVAQLKQAQGSDAMLEAYFNYSIRAGKAKDKAAEKIKATSSQAGDVTWQTNSGQTSSGSGFTRATLARSGNLVYFSPDATLVEQALAVAHKRQPALSDAWREPGAAANAVAIVAPSPIALLAEREIGFSLPRQQDAVLRGASDRYLMPKLAAIKKYPAMRLALGAVPKGTGWVALDWQPY